MKTAHTWGIFNKLNNVLAPIEEVFAFLEDVFNELMDIFPGPYIHIGADECAHKWWRNSPKTQKFIEEHQNAILLVGGIVLAIVGLTMAFSDPFRKMKKGAEKSVSLTDFMQALIMGISNPGAIFVILALFAFFGLADDAPHNWSVMPIILSLSAGSAFYWFCVTWFLSHFGKNFQMRTILWINRIAGAVIIIIGIALLGEGIFNILFQSAS